VNNVKWHILCNACGIYLRVDEVLPHSIAASVVGNRLDEVVVLNLPDIDIDKAAVIVGIKILPRHTIFHIRFPRTGELNASPPDGWYCAGDGQ
jgi:hypothetical protein